MMTFYDNRSIMCYYILHRLVLSKYAFSTFVSPRPKETSNAALKPRHFKSYYAGNQASKFIKLPEEAGSNHELFIPIDTRITC